MKKLILGGFALVLFLVIAFIVYSFYFQERVSPPDTASFSKDGLEVTIEYSRPFKKRRLIFGPESEDALQPYGEYWRLGANEATKLTINKPVDILGNRLEAGSYSMYAFPGETIWTIGFNTEANKWGAWEPDYDDDVFRIEIEATTADSIVEQMLIEIVESADHTCEIQISWEDVFLTIPVDSN